MEDNNSLASEILGMLKTQLRNAHIVIIILIIALFASNVVWLYAWNLPTDVTTTESYDIDSEDNGNAIYNDTGSVSINGTNTGN